MSVDTITIGVENGGQGIPQIRENIFFSGKYRVNSSILLISHTRKNVLIPKVG